jgi:hypothetical protein
VQQRWLDDPQVVAVAHTPPEHTSPDPQELPAQHACPLPPQTGAEVTQLTPLQMSPEAQLTPLQQACPRPPQVGDEVTQLTPLQVRPALQLEPAQQGCPAAPQVGAPVTQLLPLQVRPELHADPPQQAWPSIPQGGDTQLPAWQRSPALHALPEQHICERPPHRPMAARVQVVPLHSRPGSQRRPPQHTCPSAPQAVEVWQVPDVHSRPVSQRRPPQQGCVRIPQSMEPFWHRPSAQVVPSLQTLPAQQSWSSIPQGGARHVPMVHTSSRSQLSPRQHEAPLRPQGTHIPPWQTPPESHTSPQHDAPMPPQGGGSSGGTVTSRPGASGSASRAAVASFAASLGALRSSPVSNQGTSSAVSGFSGSIASPVSS